MNTGTPMVFAETPDRNDSAPARLEPWRILVVDDEPGILDITRQVLGRITYAGRALQVDSAGSAGEAKGLLQQGRSYALMFIDVVMETPEAGLDLVNFVRNDLGDHFARIILRTGQPGMAPEKQIVVSLDINDYKEKTELTATRLYTSVIASLREYDTHVRLDRCLRDTKGIIDGIAAVQRERMCKSFASAVLERIAALTSASGVDGGPEIPVPTMCAMSVEDGDIRILAGTGSLTSAGGGTSSAALAASLAGPVSDTFRTGVPAVLDRGHLACTPPDAETSPLVLYIDQPWEKSGRELSIVEYFLVSIAGYWSVLSAGERGRPAAGNTGGS